MAEVVLIRWPEEGVDGARLAATGVAVLYLVSGDDAPPAPQSCLEDWVRLPGDERDITARVALLEWRAETHDLPPHVDGQGRLHYRGKLVALPPAEARIAAVLTEHFGDTVTDRQLASVSEDDADAEPPTRAQMTQLRAQLRDVGLALERIRRRGYKLQHR